MHPLIATTLFVIDDSLCDQLEPGLNLCRLFYRLFGSHSHERTTTRACLRKLFLPPEIREENLPRKWLVKANSNGIGTQFKLNVRRNSRRKSIGVSQALPVHVSHYIVIIIGFIHVLLTCDFGSLKFYRVNS
ncbi:hypothetical protein LENED_004099 [Lentinula edodes]|uniref:Uncharacterized protein n=1 Tax=Lentinula edodes TaxID=5353 RepID=A0A1Q3E5C8_LENED|nr:hypothetical protein LENED_004099 [Lentinula edodes]